MMTSLPPLPRSCVTPPPTSSALGGDVSLAQYISLRLGREADETETKMLRCLSPQGLAKLNRDLLGGCCLDQTMGELRVVFVALQQRRQHLLGLLNAESRQLLQKMDREPTTTELAMFASLPTDWLSKEIYCQLQQGSSMSMIIEELAMEYKYKQLVVDANEFEHREGNGIRVVIVNLTPTVCPVTNVLVPTVVQLLPHKAKVGLSPVVEWFVDDLETSSLLNVHIPAALGAEVLLSSSDSASTTASPASDSPGPSPSSSSNSINEELTNIPMGPLLTVPPNLVTSTDPCRLGTDRRTAPSLGSAATALAKAALVFRTTFATPLTTASPPQSDLNASPEPQKEGKAPKPKGLKTSRYDARKLSAAPKMETRFLEPSRTPPESEDEEADGEGGPVSKPARRSNSLPVMIEKQQPRDGDDGSSIASSAASIQMASSPPKLMHKAFWSKFLD